jgi:hypothetical protein
VVEVDNRFVFDIPNLGTVIDVMLAIPTSLCDQVGVTLTRRWNDLNSDPDAKYTFQLSGIDK